MKDIEDVWRELDTCSKRHRVLIVGTPSSKLTKLQILEELMRLATIEQKESNRLEELEANWHIPPSTEPESKMSEKPKVPKPPKVLYQTRKGKWINPVNSYKSNRRGKRC